MGVRSCAVCYVCMTSANLQAMAYCTEDVIGLLDNDADGSYVDSSEDDLEFEFDDPQFHPESYEGMFKMIVITGTII